MKQGKSPGDQVVVHEPTPGHITITCTRCGGPMTGSDEHGMHCAKKCWAGENQAAALEVDAFFKEFMSGTLGIPFTEEE